MSEELWRFEHVLNFLNFHICFLDVRSDPEGEDRACPRSSGVSSLNVRNFLNYIFVFWMIGAILRVRTAPVRRGLVLRAPEFSEFTYLFSR